MLKVNTKYHHSPNYFHLRAMNHTTTYPPQPPRYYKGGYRYFFNGQKELILQRCLLILMFNGLRTKVGGSTKK